LRLAVKHFTLISEDHINDKLKDKAYTLEVIVEKKEVAAGILYRKFAQQSFVEIVLLVVKDEHKIKGMGSYLINNLKANLLKLEKEWFIVPYVDYDSANFFKKLGFSKKAVKGFPKKANGEKISDEINDFEFPQPMFHSL